MQNRPVVSCIIIFLNLEKYLAEAIESVLAQTFSAWELLIVDDGSTDSSTQIAKSYANRYPQQIRYLEHPNHENRGKSVSRNLGIKEAQGDMLIFLDGDDVLLPNKMQHQVALLQKYPDVGMVYGTTTYWYSWKGSTFTTQADFEGKLGVNETTLFQPPHLLTRYMQDSGIVPCLCAPLMRRELVVEVGGFDEAIQNMYEDQILLAKLILAAPVLVEPTCGEKYRQHRESSSYLAIQNGEYHPILPNPARKIFLAYLANYLQKEKINNHTLHQLVKKELWLFQYPFLNYLFALLRYLLTLGRGYWAAYFG